MRKVLIAAFVGLVTLAGAAEAQWLNYPDPRIPRTADGKPILTAPAPRAADGKPDLSGVWHVQAEPFGDQPGGVPRSTLLSEAFKIVQTSGLTLVIHELDGFPRQIYTDGRALPKKIGFPSWLGYSIGRWEQDTFVVDTIGFNDRSWLDGRGHPHSEDMHITERYRRGDVGHLDVETTIEDLKFYNKPFSFKVTHLLEVDSDIVEYFCNEAEKDLAHMTTVK